MNDNEFNSDSDESDVDFCPENENLSEDDISSEDELDDKETGSDSNEDEGDDVGNKKIRKRKCKTKSKGKCKKLKIKNKNKSNKSKDLNDSDDKKLNSPIDDNDKNEKEDKTEALWAEFLNDVDKKESTKKSLSNKDDESNEECTKTLLNKNEEQKTETIKVVEDENKEKNISMKSTTNIDNEKTIKTKFGNNLIAQTSIKKSPLLQTLPSSSSSSSSSPIGVKRQSNPGLNNLMNNVLKKNKASIFEKSKLDWNGFKTKEDLAEELNTYNKGKDGYLERKNFLQAADYKQFEIESGLRNISRNRSKC